MLSMRNNQIPEKIWGITTDKEGKYLEVINTPTSLCGAFYVIKDDLITLTPMANETNILYILHHEELHRVLNHLEGKETCWKLDAIDPSGKVLLCGCRRGLDIQHVHLVDIETGECVICNQQIKRGVSSKSIVNNCQ